MSRCICPTVEIEGKPLVEWPDADCPSHGFPKDEWRANSHLHRHARVVEVATGRVLTHDDARRLCDSFNERSGISVVDGLEWMRRFRHETPGEVERRLIGERASAPNDGAEGGILRGATQ